MRQLSLVLTLWGGLAVVCGTRSYGQSAGECPAPGALDSLIAEVRQDTVARYPAGIIGRSSKVKFTTAGNLGTSDVTLLTLVPPLGRAGRLYRVAVVHGRAYRLRGWSCDNIQEWARVLPTFAASDAKEVWRSIVLLANALNPVGNAAKLLDPRDITGLDSASRLRRLRIQGAHPPWLRKDSMGNWKGTVTVFWYDTEDHGVAAAEWNFSLSKEGLFVGLTENRLAAPDSGSAKTLIRL